jgi:hypothetical protein
MTEGELLEKLDHVKRMADIAEREWLEGDSTRANEIDHQLWIDLRREYGALKGNYRRWYTLK